ncbi:MAG: hopanoid biosynthesis-associated protein HpnK [Acidobacteria bacterium]|nr:hopanoid biosynthesis-associated protein HpnK [Acidobacteriota bacterium]
MSSNELLPRPETFIPLIINGDDFGYSVAVNRAVIRAHLEGILTSASLMVNERAVEQAVGIAKANPGLAVGLHLVLSQGRSALAHDEIPQITDRQGRFSDSPLRAGLNYYFNRQARRAMQREMRAQFERFASTGLPFSHVDGHAHLHMHPAVFDQLIPLCDEFGVKRVRVVKGELLVSLRLDRRNLPVKLVWGILFNILGYWCERKLAGRGYSHPEKVYGLLQTGDMNEKYLLGLLRKMERTGSEIYSHPIAPEADEQTRRENPGGERELQALISRRVRLAVETSGFRLSTYESLL